MDDDALARHEGLHLRGPPHLHRAPVGAREEPEDQPDRGHRQQEPDVDSGAAVAVGALGDRE
eukprot:13627264-Alexandrium_andersonii.AAC.1